MIIKERQSSRRLAFDEELRNLCYRRYKLSQELDQIDKRINQLEGAITENETLRRDISTEETLAQPQTETGGN